MLCNSESAWSDETRSVASNFTTNEVLTQEQIDRSKNRSKVFEKAISFLDSPEGKKSVKDYFDKIKKKEKTMERQSKKILKFWKSLSKTEKKELLDKFILWETAYEDMWYIQRHTQTTSTLWSLVCKIIYDKGKDVTIKYDEDFLGSAYSYKKFLLKTYCGQGCFNRLYYKDEEIFQTT